MSEIEFGNPLLVTELDKGAITSIRFSPNGERTAVGTSVGTLLIFETGADRPTVEFPAADGPINQLVWSPTGLCIFCVTESGSIWKYDVTALSVVRICHVKDTSFLSCAASPNGNELVCGTTDGVLKIIDLLNSKANTLRAHTGAITWISYRHDSEVFLTCSYDNLVRLWSCKKRQCIQTYNVNCGPLCSCSFRANGRYFLVGGATGSVKNVKFETGTVRKNYLVDVQPDYFVAFVGFLMLSETDVYVAVATSNGIMHFFKESQGQEVKAFQVQSDPFVAVDVHPTLPMIASGGGPNDMTFKLWHREIPPQPPMEMPHDDHQLLGAAGFM